jgi:hypothetical protein
MLIIFGKGKLIHAVCHWRFRPGLKTIDGLYMFRKMNIEVMSIRGIMIRRLQHFASRRGYAGTPDIKDQCKRRFRE